MSSFEAMWAGQFAQIEAQLEALRRGPRARWRSFRLHEVVCGGCGETLAEVLRTYPCPVVLSRGAKPSSGDEDLLADPAALARAMPRRLRQGEWSWQPLSDPPPAPASREDGVIFAVCRCRRVTLRLGRIFDALRRGEERRVVLPVASGTRQPAESGNVCE